MTFYYFYTYFIAHNCTFIKRQLFKTVGLYDEKYKIASDWKFFLLAVCKYNCTTNWLNITISTMTEGGISNNPEYKGLVEEERMKIMQEHFPAFIEDYKCLYNYRHNSFKKNLRGILKD
ncbi:MAG: hypothetical protein HC831_17010 [Chloroflexia bacterium]|nr:hypothetical protein [Chloroflexia bacterium]